MHRFDIFFIFLLFTAELQSQDQIFSDITLNAGLIESGINKGLSFVDFDNDGLIDLYFTRSNKSNLLYRNIGDNKFQEMAASTLLDVNRRNGMPLWGDINNDGLPDLYLAGVNEQNLLFLNQGENNFTEITNSARVGDPYHTEAVAFLDYNHDAYLDILVFNRSHSNALYVNLGDNTFINAMSRAGITGNINAMGLAIADYDNDGDQDIYLVYDGNQANNLYRNNGDGTFTDIAIEAGIALKAQGMAPAFGDFNNDGYLDLYITNMFENVLYKNNRNGTFTDVSKSAGVEDIGMGWGLTWLDYDNDGYLDLYVSNASSFNSPPDPNVLYHNNGDETFSIVNQNDPTNSLASSYGSACGDINNDGYLDLAITNEGGRNELFLNNGGSNNWLKLKLVGTASNRDAIGARITIRVNNDVQIREISGGSGWFSQNSSIVHFGLNNAETVDEIEIRWPSGLVEKFNNIQTNKLLKIIEGDSRITSVRDGNNYKNEKPNEFSLGQSYPNPFYADANKGQTSGTTLQYRIGSSPTSNTTITVYNILGQKIKTLVNQLHSPGVYTVQWDSRDAADLPVSNGIYLIKMNSAGFTQTRQVLLLE